MFQYIIDDEIELKVLEERHSEEIFKLIIENSKHLREWLPWVDNVKCVEDTKEFIRSSLEQYANNNGFQTGIWYKGKAAGVIGYHLVNWQHKNISIGYWLGSQYEGKGIMTRACKAMVKFAIEELKLHRVEIRCAEGNHKSRAIPKRLGFQEEGKIRDAEWLYDHYVSHIVYGILKEEYFKEKSLMFGV